MINNQQIRLIVLPVILLLVFFIPVGWMAEDAHPVCIHRILFGFQCPLCGMTHGVYELLHFRIVQAINYNIVVLLFPLYFLLDLVSYFHANRSVIFLRKVTVIVIFLAFCVLYANRLAHHFEWI
jgi:hypothetical protein